uniref:Secreted protein n=1 Tax=Zea mays TaxID=4577 RepID=B4FKC0_MAIZE|nr:unknown [Zea mays]
MFCHRYQFLMLYIRSLTLRMQLCNLQSHDGKTASSASMHGSFVVVTASPAGSTRVLPNEGPCSAREGCARGRDSSWVMCYARCQASP